MKYKKVTFAQVKSIIKKEGMFKGFFVGNKVSSMHFFDGWRLACECELNSLEEAEQLKNRAEIQLDSQLGTGIAWYKFI